MPESIVRRFDTVICEHVLEHVLPEAGLSLLTNIRRMLRPRGTIQISVPSPVRYISSRNGSIDIDCLGLNNVIYNHGHKFMYDARMLITLVKSAGYQNVKENSYASSPYKHLLVEEREKESIYVLAKNTN